MTATIKHLRAAEELSTTHAVAHAAALTMGDGKDLKLKRFTRQQTRLAFPEVPVDG